MNKAQMALLVRWWKQKFMNGYKHFSAVLPDDEKFSDTEQLLKTCPDGYTNWTSDRESTQPSTPSHSARLNLEELECGGSVNENIPTAHRDRQEFSFTLYDFDGHGKITKDDIAGLVTTIYETVGSSIRVPQYGSKTIKVKLTVSPGSGVENSPISSGRSGSGIGGGSSAGQTIEGHRRDGRRNRLSNKRSRRQNDRMIGVNQRVGRKESPASSRISDDRLGRLSDIEDNQNHPRLSPPLYHQHRTNLQTGPVLNCGCCGRTKKRSSSLQRQELLKIIQANMEKNNLSFQSSRKHNLWNQQSKDKSTPPIFPYLSKTKNQSTTPLQSTVIPPIPTNHSPQTTTHTPHLAKTTSSHQHKHRHREAEQARAMAQVVKWLEQEFSSKAKSGTGSTGHRGTGGFTPPPPPSPSSPSAAAVPPQSQSPPPRHEHHHIHEHVHHHYHHYRESPVPV